MDRKKIIITILVLTFILLMVLILLTMQREEQEELVNEVELTITSNVEGATVYVGQEGPFVTPEVILLPPDEYYIWGYRDDYYNIEKEIVLEEDKEVNLNFRKIPEELLENLDEFSPQFIDPNPY